MIINPNISACDEENLLSQQMFSVRANQRIKHFGKFFWKSRIYLGLFYRYSSVSSVEPITARLVVEETFMELWQEKTVCRVCFQVFMWKK